MKKLLHLALAAVAVLLLATACKPDSETTEYVTDSHSRRLVSKIEIESILSDEIGYVETEFNYDKDLRVNVVRRKERYNDESWRLEECRYEYFSDRIVARYTIKKDYVMTDSIVNMIGPKGYIDSCLWYEGETVSQKYTYSHDLNGRLTADSYYHDKYEWEGDLLSMTFRPGREFHYKYLSDRTNHANIGFVNFSDLYDCIDLKSMIKNYFSNFSTGFVSECTSIWDEKEPYSYTIDYSFDDAGFVDSFVVFGWEEPTDEDHVKISYLKK